MRRISPASFVSVDTPGCEQKFHAFRKPAAVADELTRPAIPQWIGVHIARRRRSQRREIGRSQGWWVKTGDLQIVTIVQSPPAAPVRRCRLIVAEPRRPTRGSIRARCTSQCRRRTATSGLAGSFRCRPDNRGADSCAGPAHAREYAAIAPSRLHEVPAISAIPKRPVLHRDSLAHDEHIPRPPHAHQEGW